jgi:pimeloyl-ACP methyl ester carboxylesterase
VTNEFLGAAIPRHSQQKGDFSVDSYKSVAATEVINSGAASGTTQSGLPEGTEPHLRFYKSVEGYNAIMSWYESALESVEVPLASKYVETRFGRTHMLTCGPEDAPALFLIPGTAGCAPLWRRQFAAFAKHFRVYALDVIGQPGRSEANTLSLLNDDVVVWLKDVMDELGLEKAHFAGNSVGGWMAMRMGIEAPDRVDRVVMLGPTGLTRTKLPVKIWFSKVMSKKQDADALEDDLTAKSITSPSASSAEGSVKGSFGTFDRQLARLMALCTRHYRVDRSLDVYNHKTGKIYIRKGLRVLGKFFLSERKSYLKNFEVPGLLIFGEHEMFFNPNKVADRACKIMPGLESNVVDNAGHGAVYDRPDHVNELVIEYLNR